MESKLTDLHKAEAKLTLGIDCSTHSLAFGIFQGLEPVTCGEVKFEGKDVFQRLGDAHRKTPALIKSGLLQGDYVAFEGAIIQGNNAKVGIYLSYVYGAVMGALMDDNKKVVTVPPITWQSWIGNPNLKPFERQEIKVDYPDKSDSWRKNFGRQLRKQRSLKFARQFFPIENGSDNVGDAVCIAWYAVNNLTTKA
jgi:hypothetical protein